MNKMKKPLSLLLAFVMVLGMVNLTAFATTTADQIGKYQAYDENGHGATKYELDREESIKTLEKGDLVMSKIIAPTNAENVFDITLSVTTTTKMETIPLTQDAAVVLMLDNSSSMGSGKGSQLEQAKAAAIKFVTSFGKNSDGTQAQGKRWVSVVTFDGDADRLGTQIWMDAASTNGLEALKTAISSIRKGSGTNPEAALMLANNIYDLSGTFDGTNKIADLKSRFAILMTDGEPYGYVKKDDSTYDANSKQHIGPYDKVGKGYESANRATVAAKNLKDQKAVTLYTMAFNTENAELYYKKSNSSRNTKGTVGGWLKNCVASNPQCYRAAGEDITIQFDEINKAIQKLMQAWTVDDPMGAHIKLVDKDVYDTHGAAVQDTATGLTWNIKQETSPDPVKNSNGDDTYTYTLTYRVRLDTTDAGFNAGTYYPTNGATKLTYTPNALNTDGTINTNPELKYAYFNVPTVKGFAGNLEFKKVDANDTSKALSGAKFTLTHDAECACGGNWSAGPVMSGADGTVTFSNIPSGHTYTLTETKAPDGYVKSTKTYKVNVSYGVATLKDESNTITSIENEPEIKYWTGKLQKIWIDDGDGRPGNVTLTLEQYKKAGESWTKTDKKCTFTLDTTMAGTDAAANTWTYQVLLTEAQQKGLVSKDSDGAEYTYKLAADNVDGYNAVVSDNGLAVTNTRKGDNNVTVSGKKTWIGPAKGSVRVQLVKNGTPVADTFVTVTGPDWTYKFENLPSHENGHKITYTVQEVDELLGYTKEINGYDITNRVDQVEKDLTVTKVWVDDNNAQKLRPESVDVNLLANGSIIGTATLSANNNWQYTFEDLYTYFTDGDGKVTGVAINYTVEEVGLTDGKLFVGSDGDYYECTVNGTTITNTLKGTINISGNKEWVDPVGEPVEHPNVTFRINYKVGAFTTSAVATLDENGTFKFEGLPKYDASGKLMKYDTVTEVMDGENAEHYTAKVDHVEGTYTWTFTNTYQKETVVNVTKEWNDQADTSGRSEITVRLYANGEPTGETLVLNEGNNWTGAFTGLDKYAELPVEDEDTENGEGEDPVKPVEPDGEEGGDKEPVVPVEPDGEEDGDKEPVVPVEPDGEEDGDKEPVVPVEPDGEEGGDKEPVVPVEPDGEEGGDKEPVVPVEPDGEEGGDKEPVAPEVPGDNTGDIPAPGDDVTVEDGVEENTNTIFVPTANAGNETEYREITYTVVEENVPNGYEVSYSGSGYNFTITNTLTGTTSVSGTKTWVDDGNKYNTRPEKIKFNLLQNGEQFKSVEIGKGESGYSFTGLDKYDEKGAEYVYTVTEEPVSGYSSSNDGYNFTNKLAQAYKTFQVNKVWIGGSEDHPAITIKLLQDGVEIDSVTLANGTTEHTFGLSNEGPTLPVFKFDEDGNVTGEYLYTVSEDTVEGYVATFSEDHHTVYNVAPAQFVFTKQWLTPATGEELTALLRETEFTIYQQKGNDPATKTVYATITAEQMKLNPKSGVYRYLVDGPVADLDSTPYYYTVEETKVPVGYTSEQLEDGTHFVNTIKPGEVTLKGTKEWVGGPDRDDYSITVNVKRDGSVLIEGLKFGPAADATDPKTFSFTISDYTVDGETVSLPKYAPDGHEYKYELEEVNPPENYEPRVTDDAASEAGCKITNTYVEPTAYYYEVVAIYITFDENGVVISKSTEVQVLPVTGGLKDQTVSFDANNTENAKWQTYGEHTYAYDSSIEGSRPSATLTDPTVTEKLVVYYVRTQRDSGGSGGTPTTGSLAIEKKVVGGGSEATSKTYSFTVSGPNGYSNTVSITGSGRRTLSGLTPGSYTVTENDASIAGYTLSTSGEGSATVSVGSTASIAVTNTYTEDIIEEDPPLVDLPSTDQPSTDLPDEQPPLTDLPDEEPPLVDMPDEQPPLTDLPVEWPPIVVADDPVDIPEEDVPLADVPQTGDYSKMWYAAVIASIAGLAVLTFKKREDEEEA